METNNLILPWKQTPDDKNLTLAYDLINKINFSVQRIVDEQTHITEVFTNYGKTPDEIMTDMGEDAALWLNVYNATLTYIENISSLASKSVEDIVPESVISTATDIVRPISTGYAQQVADQQILDAVNSDSTLMDSVNVKVSEISSNSSINNKTGIASIGLKTS